MLRISKLTDYATVIMAHMATAESNAIHSAGTIAAATNIALPTVGKILKALTQAELLASYRGSHGGYRLCCAPEKIGIIEIITALEGPPALTECCSDDGHCDHKGRCQQRPHWQMINQAVINTLSRLRLSDLLCTQTVPLNTLSSSSTTQPTVATESVS